MLRTFVIKDVSLDPFVSKSILLVQLQFLLPLFLQHIFGAIAAMQNVKVTIRTYIFNINNNNSNKVING